MSEPSALLWDRPAGKPHATLLFAHGAGAPMDSDFMTAMSTALVVHGIAVARFEFPYMARRRAGGGKRPPDRQPVLLAAFHDALRAMPDSARCFIGGKSMGGRMASLLAAEGANVPGVVCFGYPFHPPGKLATTRTAHLPGLPVPMLVCQGVRDPFGTQEQVAGYLLGQNVSLHWVPDGDHDLKPRKASGLTHRENIAAAAAAARAFMVRASR